MVAFEIPLEKEVAHKSKRMKIEHVRHDFFECDKTFTWSLYVKEIDQSSCSVTFNSDNADIRFKTRDQKFLQNYEKCDKETTFEYKIDLKDDIKSAECKFNATSTKLEIKFAKSKTLKWNGVFKSAQTVEQPVVKIGNDKPILERMSEIDLKNGVNANTNSNSIKSQQHVTTTNAHPPPEPMKVQRGQFYGHTGLANLGNTCYMNATLQCLANTTDLRDFFLDHQTFQKQINTTNPLGLKGALAISYAILMKQMWSGTQQQLSPFKIRDLIAEKYPHFKGYQQQDAQEFMGSVLSLLHEDLNRIEKRPVLEPLESDGWTDTKISEESWKRFLSRDDSIIVDNFFGQFKSKLTCPICNKVSIIFEACNSVLLPIPAQKMRIHSIVVFQNSDLRAIKFIAEVPKNGQYQDIIEQLGEIYAIKASEFRIYKAFKGKIVQTYTPNSLIDSFEDDAYLVINEVLCHKKCKETIIELQVEQYIKYTTMPDSCNHCKQFPGENQTLKRCTKCFNVAYCNSDCQRNDWTDHKNVCIAKEQEPIGVPFTVSIKACEFVNTSVLKQRLINYSKNFIDVQNKSESEIGETSLYSNFELIIKTPKNSDIQFKTLTDLLSYVKLHHQHNDASTQTFLVSLSWVPKVNIEIADQNLINLHVIPSRSVQFKAANHQNDCTSLDECLKLFSKAEKLTPENPWYCPKCKKHQEATKQIYLWKLPKYLIIILKRFQAHKQDTSNYPEWVKSRYNYLLQNHVSYEKLNTLIDFPLYNLDMSKYIYDPLNDSRNNENIYDLHSVINHLGDSLYSGHYTAFSRCHESNDTLKNSLGWRLFDDSYVRNVHENNIVTSDAYVLFYRRRESTLNHHHFSNPAASASASATSHEEEFYSCEDEEEDEERSDSSATQSDESEDLDVCNNAGSYTNLNELD